MLKIENHCVSCGLPCIGDDCPNRNIRVRYCDECGEEGAEYVLNDTDLCRECMERYLKDRFNELTIAEKLRLFTVPYEEVI